MEDKPVPETITINCKEAQDIKGLHRLLAQALDFPSFYGNNWNALWDAITGLVEMPENLVFINFNHLKTAFPEQWKIMEDLLDEWLAREKKLNERLPERRKYHQVIYKNDEV